MGPIIWLIAAGLLFLGELLVADMSLLMLGTAAAITAGVAVVDIPVWAEILVFGVASVALILAIRPMLRRRLLKNSQEHKFDDSELAGKRAEVIEPVSDQAQSGGMVRVAGELWSARSANPGDTYSAGESVQVLSIDGTTAVVWKNK
ncbi:NfeD family protein [Corynebacterium sp. c9Ua_112]|uniref:NfeD family protein n=1 Tax=Corynebacterium macclintockiae TaxID=2913501 RepID=A0A9X3M7K3_9CORY|nr:MULTISPECIES: NfeD family protein [Corynebacterium]MBC6795822.1 NfeD family protein [Corynebacterium sp. LK28]MCZ9304510.1 NfeD family protein [Corynebacterium macclintockiae]MDK8890346.1 NfeD family protein [Corynebacterium macclintockiae]